MQTSSLTVHMHRSPGLAALLAITHVAAMACAVRYLPGWGWPAAASMVLAANLIYQVRLHALLLSKNAVTALRLRDPNRCECTTRDGRVLDGRVEPSSFVTPVLIVVNLRIDGRRWPRSVVLLPDSAAAGERRQLRVWLRHRVREESAAVETG